MRVLLCLSLLLLVGCAPKPAVIEGQMFIGTKGGQSIKLGAVEVRVLDQPEMEAAAASAGAPSGGHIGWAALPNGHRHTQTDADGRFRVEVPPGPHYLVAHSQRRVGSNTEQYYWLEQIQAKPGEVATAALTHLNHSETDWLTVPDLSKRY